MALLVSGTSLVAGSLGGDRGKTTSSTMVSRGEDDSRSTWESRILPNGSIVGVQVPFVFRGECTTGRVTDVSVPAFGVALPSSFTLHRGGTDDFSALRRFRCLGIEGVQA